MSITHRLKTALGVGSSGAPKNSVLDEALLFGVHEKALGAADSATRTAQAAGATASQQRAAIDAAADHSRLLLARGRDARSAAQQVRDSIERAKLIALNAGLEGSRLGDASGKALLTVSDELRGVLSRGLDALDEHIGLLSQMERERERLRDQLEHARERGTALADELLRSQNLQRVARDKLQELGDTIQRATGADPDMARQVSEAALHARGLLEALTALSNRPDRGWMLRALGPSLRPLLRLLRDVGSAEAPHGDGEA
jgi:hypothetical protein